LALVRRTWGTAFLEAAAASKDAAALGVLLPRRQLDVNLVATGTFGRKKRGTDMSLGTILLIVLVLLLIGALPNWGHSRAWGRGPAGILGLILVIVLILVLLGKI
jgi:hypothetical protein